MFLMHLHALDVYISGDNDKNSVQINMLSKLVGCKQNLHCHLPGDLVAAIRGEDKRICSLCNLPTCRETDTICQL